MAEVGSLEVVTEAAGAAETRQEIESVSDTLEDAGDEMSDTSDQMSGLSRQIQGAGLAIAGALAVTTAGILASVPIVGEAFAGLRAIWDAVMLQVDDLLRAFGLGGLGGMFFNIAEWIGQLEGPVGWLVGAIGTLTVLAGAAFAAFAAYVGPITALVAAKGALVAAAKLLVAGIVALVAALGAPVVIAGLVIAALALLAWYFRDEVVGAINALIGWLVGLGERFMGLLDSIVNFTAAARLVIAHFISKAIDAFVEFTASVLSKIASFVVSATSKFASWTAGVLSDIATFVTNFVSGIAGMATDALAKIADFIVDVTDKITGLVSDGADWAKDFVVDFAKWIGMSAWRILNAVGDFISDVGSKIDDLISDAVDWGKDLVQGFIDGIENKIQAVKNVVNNLAQAVRDRMPGSPAKTGPLSDLDETGPGLTETFAQGIAQTSGQVTQATEGVAGAAAGGDGQGVIANRQQDIRLYLDGRETSRVTRQYADDTTNVRGRFGSD